MRERGPLADSFSIISSVTLERMHRVCVDFTPVCSTCLYSIKLQKDPVPEQNTQISAENHVIRYPTPPGVAL